MELVLILLKQSLIMWVYLAIGVLLCKKNIITEKGSSELGKMLLYLIMPVAIIRSFAQSYSFELFIGLVVSFIAAACVLLASMFLAKVFFHNGKYEEEFGAAFSNAGFIGIPLVKAVIGNEAVFYVASFIAILNILQWTYGIYIITENREEYSVKKLVKNPIVISLFVGIILFFLPIEIPKEIYSIFDTISNMNAPVAMIVVGSYMTKIHIKEMFISKKAYQCSGVRLIVIPIVTILILLVIPVQYTMIKTAILIVSAAPVGSNVAILANLYRGDYLQSVKDICLSTMLSIVTLPCIVMISTWIW